MSTEQLGKALGHIGAKIIRYNPDKQKSVVTKNGSMTVKKFAAYVRGELMKTEEGITGYPKVLLACDKEEKMHELVEQYAEEHKLNANDQAVMIPEELKGLVLNCDMTAKGRDDRFFLTHSDETVSRISGEVYIGISGMKVQDAFDTARKVIPEYLPREAAGILDIKYKGKESQVFNKYIPPEWKKYPYKRKLPDELPSLFRKLVNHLFPIKEEREYFFSWLYASLFERSFVYLVLCSKPGTGKNRLKLVMRALHGLANSVDGKRSTLVERFNSQLSDSTLAWFDELSYDMDMENVMKELQNDSISIERKGVDATRATRIHASIVISNNKPRDNYIAFDARKFVPLKVTGKRLEASMLPSEIDLLTKKVENEDADTFDIKFLAQIAMWVKKHGKNHRWANLEYRGPMFWTLAHTSMSRWQKRAAISVLEANPKSSARIVYNEEKGFLWSSLQEVTQKRNGDRSLQFPDFTTVKYFFDIFKDGKGEKAFKTRSISGNIMGDFYVKPLIENMKIVTEASHLGKTNEESKEQKAKKEEYLDL